MEGLGSLRFFRWTRTLEETERKQIMIPDIYKTGISGERFSGASDRCRGNVQGQRESEGERAVCGPRHALGRPGWTIGGSIRQGPRRLQ